MTRWRLLLAALAGALLGAAAVLLAGGGAATSGRSIRDYLLAHPEVISDAMAKLQDRETGKAIAADRTAIETPIGSAWGGNPRGDVTVVEYFDYNCSFCRASLPTIASLIAADHGVRVVYREFPILAESSRDAARLSLAAAMQGKFAAFHDAVYAAGPVSDATLSAAAAKAGLDLVAARAQAPAADAAIKANYQVAQRLGMQGTPAWIIGDRVLSGALSLDQLEQAVDAARHR